MYLYCIRDVVTSHFGSYFVASNDEDAKRVAFAQLSNNPFIDDLELWECGIKLESDIGRYLLNDIDDKFKFVAKVKECGRNE